MINNQLIIVGQIAAVIYGRFNKKKNYCLL